MKICQTLTCLLLSIQILFAQTEDDKKNVTILKSVKEFRFVKGDKEHPVQVKEETTKTYTCNSFRTNLPIVQFYNNMNPIDDLDIWVDNSKKHGIVPADEYYGGNGIFYSDVRVRHFKLPLLKKGSTSEVKTKRTVLEPSYFTSIYFMDQVDIQEQEVKIYVPSWMNIEIKEYNFNGYNINRQVKQDGGQTIYTFIMQHIPGFPDEPNEPGPSYYAPHLLILTKFAQPGDKKITYFNTLADQYNWYASLIKDIGDDEKLVGDKAREIIAGASTDEEKVKKIYQWVQDNIRYIAFEDGIAGFKPDKAQEVLRKKYGDCKGMANLLTVMLKAIGLDARRCWIGTNHIAYDYSTPSLSVDNHMICAWAKPGGLVFLDATEKYIGYGEVAERIQGRQTLVENGTGYLLERVPVAAYSQNTALEKRKLTIDGNDLKGHITHTWKGENKEWLLSQIHDINKEKQEEALKRFLTERKPNFVISNLRIGNLTDYNTDLTVEYDVVWKNALTSFNTESYLDPDNRKSFENSKIEIAKRKLPYQTDFKNHIVFESEIELPVNKTVNELPKSIDIQKQGYQFAAGYNIVGNKLVYRNEIKLLSAEIKPDAFASWNSDIEQLNNFYNQQLTLTLKK